MASGQGCHRFLALALLGALPGGLPDGLAAGVSASSAGFAATGAAPAVGRHDVTLGTPAAEWLEGLPLGNGISAAMVWGTPASIVLSLNHVDFWRDNLRKGSGSFSTVVRNAQRLMLEGKPREANELYACGVNMDVMPRQQRPYHGFSGYTNSYQPIGDLLIELDGQPKITDYRRTLNLRDGIASIRYRADDAQVRQEYYIPAGADVVMVRLAADKPFSGRIRFSRPSQTGYVWYGVNVPQPKEYQWKCIARETSLSIEGRFEEGVASAVLATAEGVGGKGAITAEPSALRFRDLTELRLLIAIEAGRDAGEFAPACSRKVKAVLGSDWDAIRKTHCNEHRAMFDRADVTLGAPPRQAWLDSDHLVANAVAGKYDGQLAELVFQMGRYLMMSCNRAGRRPANLQGIWNNQIEPMWDADWHLDMNVEMNHWLCNPANLDECNMALFRQMERLVEPGRRTAESLAGAKGILFYTVAGGDGMTWTQQGGFFTGAAGWIAQHFWTHYEFTLDREFLANHAYPFLKQAGLFYRDFLVKNRDGKYVTALSHSPENVPPNGQVNNIHSTIDTAIVRELMRHLLEAGHILNVDRGLWPVWQDLHDHVLPYPVSGTGVLKEWPAPLEEQPLHRHYSHLYPLFPGDEFTPELTTELFAAARGAVNLREAQGRAANFGWSYPYLACFYARLGEGDKALDNLHCLARAVTVNNLLTCATEWRGQGLTGGWEFNVPRLFQIEAGLGATAAITEMLLQSHRGYIQVLPALPAAWSSGQFRGLKARGAFVVDATWTDGKVQEVVIESLKGTPCQVLCRRPWTSVDVVEGAPGAFSVDASSKVIRFDTQPGGRYRLHFK